MGGNPHPDCVSHDCPAKLMNNPGEAVGKWVEDDQKTPAGVTHGTQPHEISPPLTLGHGWVLSFADFGGS
jgi:hypothetical protein